MKITTKRIGDRLETGEMWEDDADFPDSYPTTIKRLTCPKNNVKKDLELHTEIHIMVAKYQGKVYAQA